MNLRALKAAVSVGGGVKMLLATTGPLQTLFDRPGKTHEFCNRQALTILKRDGLGRCARFFERHLKDLNAGVYWADEGWKNVGHYFEPGSAKGLWRFPSAVWDFRHYFERSLYHARRGDGARAAFYVGAAAHLVQDLCVPHHARAKLLDGHKQFETWAERHHASYAVESGGVYHENHPAHALLIRNAAVAADLLSWVGPEGAELSYHKATAILLPRAQRTTAGLFLQFYAAAGGALQAA